MRFSLLLLAAACTTQPIESEPSDPAFEIAAAPLDPSCVDRICLDPSAPPCCILAVTDTAAFFAQCGPPSACAEFVCPLLHGQWKTFEACGNP